MYITFRKNEQIAASTRYRAWLTYWHYKQQNVVFLFFVRSFFSLFCYIQHTIETLVRNITFRWLLLCACYCAPLLLLLLLLVEQTTIAKRIYVCVYLCLIEERIILWVCQIVLTTKYTLSERTLWRSTLNRLWRSEWARAKKRERGGVI